MRATTSERAIVAAVASRRLREQPRYLVVATRYGERRHMMVVAKGWPPELLCGHDGDAETTRRLARKGRGSIRLPDCKSCARYILDGTHRAPPISRRSVA